MAHLAGIQLGTISIDDPGLLELRNTAQAGRWRQPDRRCQIHICDPRIVLKCAEDCLVNPVHNATFPRLLCQNLNYT